MLETWAWRLDTLAEAVTLRRKLAGYGGARWPDWPATQQRLAADHAAKVARIPAARRAARGVTTDAGDDPEAPDSLWRKRHGT